MKAGALLVVVGVLAGIAAVCGCDASNQPKWPVWPKPPARPAAKPSAKPAAGDQPAAASPAQQKLLDEVAALKSDNEILQARIQELTEREARLVDEVKRLRLETSQQARQIAVLAEAPTERDYYQDLARRLTAENLRLKRDLAAMIGLDPLPAATQPTTQPATREAAPETQPEAAGDAP